MIETGTVIISIDNKIATIQFGHPAGNSFPSKLLGQLTDALNDLSNNPEVNVIQLKSLGSGAFCAGASFDELLTISDLEEGTKFFSGFANVLNAMRKCSKIIVGRIHGRSVGGGVGLIAGCDYAMASTDAQVKLSELAIGIGPFVIAPAVERRIGLAGLTEMCLEPTAWKSAQWAKEKGLFAEVFDNVNLLDEAVEKFCRNLTTYNPEALRNMKATLWQGTDHWETLLFERAAISGHLVLSDFTRKALDQLKK